jgi:tyrosine-protein phosphatase SIW14
VYRSSYPTKKTLPFLKQIGVRSVVYLCLEEYTEGSRKFLEDNGIALFPHGTPGDPQLRSPSETLHLTAPCRQQRAI